MLGEIGSVAKVPEFIKRVKAGEGNNRLMGFGHRVYKSYDPRAKVIKRIADLVFAVTGKNPRSEEHTSELQSHSDLVCRLLLEKKKKKKQKHNHRTTHINKQKR